MLQLPQIMSLSYRQANFDFKIILVILIFVHPVPE